MMGSNRAKRARADNGMQRMEWITYDKMGKKYKVTTIRVGR